MFVSLIHTALIVTESTKSDPCPGTADDFRKKNNASRMIL